MIGISLSLCIPDLAFGKVKLDDVEMIVTGTAARTADDWERLIKQYRELHWPSCADRAEVIVRQLRDEGRIEQPRLTHRMMPMVLDGPHWVQSMDDIIMRRTS